MSNQDGPTRDIFDAGGRALRHNGLRRANEKTVLTVVGFNSGVSNAEIARMSGLAPQTVSAILVGLERDGLVTRGSVLRGRRGQPATPILLNADGAYSIGIEIGWQHLDVLLINMHAEVLGHHHIDYAYPDAGTIFDVAGEMVTRLMTLLTDDQRQRLLDIGLAMPGRIAENLDQLNAPSEQAELWRDLDGAAEMARRVGLDVSVFNDGNAACWAELIALPQPRPANILYFMVSHFVGAGVVGDGVLWSGPTGNAANLGAMLVQLDAEGPRQAHEIASLWALDQRLKRAGKPQDIIRLAQWDWAAIEKEVEDWLGDCARALARTAFNATTVVESPLLIIDTILGPAITERLATRLEAELAALPVRGFMPPRVVRGFHGARAAAVGAAELPLFRRYF